MEWLAGLAAAIAVLVPLAAVGIVTIAAFAMMVLFGLLTDWSFKRNFITSFAVGLLAPFVVAAMVAGAIEDGSLQRELQVSVEGDLDELLDSQPELRELLPPPEQVERVLEKRPELRERIPADVLEALLDPTRVIEDGSETDTTAQIEGEPQTEAGTQIEASETSE